MLLPMVEYGCIARFKNFSGLAVSSVIWIQVYLSYLPLPTCSLMFYICRFTCFYEAKGC